MRIVIDASQIVYETGVSVYTRNLIHSLLDIDKENTYQIIGGSFRRYSKLKKILDELTIGKKNVDNTVFPSSPALADLIFNRIGFINADIFTGKSDVFHSSDWTQPRSNAFKVTTIHDLVPLLFPKLTHSRIVDVHKRRLARVKKYADWIIAPSNQTKGDLINSGFSKDKISVIPEAVDIGFKKAKKADIEALLKKFHINEKYLLCIGANPRKNIDRVITAFERVRVKHSFKLVVVGEAKDATVARNVIYLGHLSQDSLVKIFSGAEALLYPSLYEGYGLPILEAFHLGVPVLTSNLGSMMEIAGSSAVLVDPYDVCDIYQGILKLISGRKEYIKKGKETVEKYSWKDIAMKTIEVYKKSIH